MDTRWLLFVFAFAQVVLLQPPSVPDLYIVTLPSGNPITVYLFGSDPHNETLQVQIESLPLHGELFQTFDGFTKQDKIKQYDYVVDPLSRVLYQPNHQDIFTDMFQFRVQDSSVPSRIATVTIEAKEPLDNSSLACQDTPNTLRIVGEAGLVGNLSHAIKTVNFRREYRHPVVIAEPPSFKGSDPAVVRIVSVNSTSFSLYVQESPQNDQSHTKESVSYLVIEEGLWRLQDGTIIEAGRLVSAATVGRQVPNDQKRWEHVTMRWQNSSAVPVVISQVQTNNDPHWVHTRLRNIKRNSFDVALEEEEANELSHGGEVIGYLAVVPTTTNWFGRQFEAGRTGTNVNNKWYTINFQQTFNGSINFLAAMQTFKGPDSAHLRHNSLSNNSVKVKIEEDASLDGETTHTKEDIGYIAIQGDSDLTAIHDPCYQVPLAQPQMVHVQEGKLQDIQLIAQPNEYQVAVIVKLPQKGLLLSYQNGSTEPIPITMVPTTITDIQQRVWYQSSIAHQPYEDEFQFTVKIGAITSEVATITVEVETSTTSSSTSSTSSSSSTWSTSSSNSGTTSSSSSSGVTTSQSSSTSMTSTQSSTSATSTHSSSTYSTGSSGSSSNTMTHSSSTYSTDSSYPTIPPSTSKDPNPTEYESTQAGNPTITMLILGVAVVFTFAAGLVAVVVIIAWKWKKKRRQTIPMLSLIAEEEEDELLANFDD